MESKMRSKTTLAVGVSLIVHLPLVISAISIIIYNFEQSSGEDGDYFEGDMAFDDSFQFSALNSKHILLHKKFRWPNATVSYYFDSVASRYAVILFLYSTTNFYSGPQQQNIMTAMTLISSKAPCIKFNQLKKTGMTNAYVHVTDTKSGCFSTVGHMNRQQFLNVNRESCASVGIIAHELLHTLGMFHMQSNYNRDEYVDVIWQNIRDGRERNFKKEDHKKAWDFDLGYDYDSIMHYKSEAFSKNKKPTMRPKNTNAIIGQRDHLSKTDIKKLNIMYCACKQ